MQHIGPSEPTAAAAAHSGSRASTPLQGSNRKALHGHKGGQGSQGLTVGRALQRLCNLRIVHHIGLDAVAAPLNLPSGRDGSNVTGMQTQARVPCVPGMRLPTAAGPAGSALPAATARRQLMHQRSRQRHAMLQPMVRRPPCAVAALTLACSLGICAEPLGGEREARSEAGAAVHRAGNSRQATSAKPSSDTT